MCHIIKTDEALAWGWSKLICKNILLWTRMINKKTENAVVLGMLGKGADGNVLLVANKKG